MRRRRRSAPPAPARAARRRLRDPGGLALGAILSALVISLVSVTAGAAEPEPPLRLVARRAAARWPPQSVYVALAALLVVAATATARRALRPARRRWRREHRDRAARRLPRPLDARKGDAAALQGLSLERRGRRGAGGARPERLRQVDAAPPARRARAAVGRRRPRATARTLGKLPSRRLARYRSTLLGYADQHYARALAPELTARRLVALQLGLRGTRARERLAPRRRAARARRARATSATAPPRRAVGRRAAARCALRRARTPAAGVPRGRAHRRARRRDRRPGVRHALGELVREHGCTTVVVSHDPESARDRRPRRAHPRRARVGGVVARRRRRATRSSSAAAAGCACRKSCCCARGSASKATARFEERRGGGRAGRRPQRGVVAPEASAGERPAAGRRSSWRRPR